MVVAVPMAIMVAVRGTETNVVKWQGPTVAGMVIMEVAIVENRTQTYIHLSIFSRDSFFFLLIKDFEFHESESQKYLDEN